ncbi:lipocalin family protein [Pseudoxanthomonas dokdonensis]|uniref:Outer membrane lipoprotein Blc n=1 Tax=Pseudoxanthomonas dokdonensis TaxID=344882 RepID=A0A0R0CV64_9GAMM|nr:lipocalin family protein [Pseudoxanthomonas dokdonensis]KRG69991.1 membrane protein [Pseudoxanthomonas dokdonensis]
MNPLPLLLFAVASAASPVSTAQTPVNSVAQLDLKRYAGEWHEIARLPMRYEKDCVGDITATYTINADGSIGVRNACRIAGGETKVSDGEARAVAGHPGRLQVRFAPSWLSWLPMVWADYWVLAIADDYSWALVGEPDRKYLWVLARDPVMSRPLLDSITARARGMGYKLDDLIIAAPVHD